MMKRSILLTTVLLFLVFSFTSVAAASVDAKIISFNPASGAYYPGDTVTSSIQFKNTGTQTWTYWISYSVRDESGKVYTVSPNSVKLRPGKTSIQTKSWTVPTDVTSKTGKYKVVMSVWKYKSSTRLTYIEKRDAFTVSMDNRPSETSEEPLSENPEETFSLVDNFDTFDTNKWSKSSFKLERTYFQPENIDVKDGNLRIKLPANTLNGGEIESKSLYKYGTYRARMKLPNAPSSITGFFLYMDPDFYSEIDIEVYNDKNGKIDFTTYAGGREQNFATKSLGFDPTADFHEYRFDFYPGNLSFYVDGKLLQRWTDGMPRNSM
uniref:glycoside hydrolase family 16 protein n=2 Tax=Methanomethylovorans sp. TaxID=2758717 RepID=UPI001BD1BD7F